VIGKEIADAIIPLVVAGVFLAMAYFIYRKLAGGAVAKDDLEEAEQAQEEKRSVRDELRATRRRMRDSWRSGRVSKPPRK